VVSALSVNSNKYVENDLNGFSAKKEIEPEDNIERDNVSS